MQLIYCSSLQPIVTYNVSEIESTFPVSFGECVLDCLCPCGMVSICLIGKNEYDWFLHEYEELLVDWLFFLLYLLQSVCCSKYSTKKTKLFYLNPFLHFLYPFVLKYFTIFITVPNAAYISLTSKVFHEGNLEENFINFVGFCFHGLVWWRLIVSK